MNLLPQMAVALLLTSVLLTPPLAVAADPPDIPLAIENNRFKPDEIKVKAGEGFILVISNNLDSLSVGQSTRVLSILMEDEVGGRVGDEGRTAARTYRSIPCSKQY